MLNLFHLLRVYFMKGYEIYQIFDYFINLEFKKTRP